VPYLRNRRLGTFRSRALALAVRQVSLLLEHRPRESKFPLGDPFMNRVLLCVYKRCKAIFMRLQPGLFVKKSGLQIFRAVWKFVEASGFVATVVAAEAEEKARAPLSAELLLVRVLNGDDKQRRLPRYRVSTTARALLPLRAALQPLAAASGFKPSAPSASVTGLRSLPRTLATRRVWNSETLASRTCKPLHLQPSDPALKPVRAATLWRRCPQQLLAWPWHPPERPPRCSRSRRSCPLQHLPQTWTTVRCSRALPRRRKRCRQQLTHTLLLRGRYSKRKPMRRR
jgi:hypothetical protein